MKKHLFIVLIFSALFNMPSISQEWINIDFPDADNPIVHNATIKAVSNRLFIGTWGEGLYYSDDKGSTWEKCTDVPSIAIYVIEYDPENSILYAGGSNGMIYKSTDNGESWTDVSLTNLLYYDFDLYGLKAFNNKLYAGVFSQGAFVSDDFGVTWDSIQTGLGDFMAQENSGRFIYDLDVCNDRLILVGANGLWYSDNEGQNWIRNEYFPSGCYTNNIEVIGDKIFVGSDLNSIYLSEDNCNSWEDVYSNTPAGVRSFANVNGVLYSGMGQGHIKYYNEENNDWVTISDDYMHGSNYFVMGMEHYDDKLYIACYVAGGIEQTAVRYYDLLVGVSENEPQIEFSCFVDPNRNKIIINSDVVLDKITIVNMQGQYYIVDKKLVDNSYEINTQGLKSGLYIVRAYSPNQRGISKKVFIE